MASLANICQHSLTRPGSQFGSGDITNTVQCSTDKMVTVDNKQSFALDTAHVNFRFNHVIKLVTTKLRFSPSFKAVPLKLPWNSLLARTEAYVLKDRTYFIVLSYCLDTNDTEQNFFFLIRICTIRHKKYQKKHIYEGMKALQKRLKIWLVPTVFWPVLSGLFELNRLVGQSTLEAC